MTLCLRKFSNVKTVRTLHFLSDEYDDLTASIYVLVQLKQITHCLNALSSQVEPDAEEYSYQFSVKIIGLPEISSKLKKLRLKQDLFASNSFRKWELKYPFLTPI